MRNFLCSFSKADKEITNTGFFSYIFSFMSCIPKVMSMHFFIKIVNTKCNIYLSYLKYFVKLAEGVVVPLTQKPPFCFSLFSSMTKQISSFVFIWHTAVSFSNSVQCLYLSLYLSGPRFFKW